MYNIALKLYSVLRLEYKKSNSYDVQNGIEISVPEPISIKQLCHMVGIDFSEVSFATVNGAVTKDLSEILPRDSLEIGLYPLPPAGG